MTITLFFPILSTFSLNPPGEYGILRVAFLTFEKAISKSTRVQDLLQGALSGKQGLLRG